MPKAKIAITLESTLLDAVDGLVRQHQYPNRSQAIAAAVTEKLARVRRARLAEACALLDPMEERALAEEAIGEDLSGWPEY